MGNSHFQHFSQLTRPWFAVSLGVLQYDEWVSLVSTTLKFLDSILTKHWGLLVWTNSRQDWIETSPHYNTDVRWLLRLCCTKCTPVYARQTWRWRFLVLIIWLEEQPAPVCLAEDTCSLNQLQGPFWNGLPYNNYSSWDMWQWCPVLQKSRATTPSFCILNKQRIRWHCHAAAYCTSILHQ